MSEFSEFCRILQEKSGMTIYQMAKVSGMERTALNRMVIGKRLPKQEDVDAFCKVVLANEKEKSVAQGALYNGKDGQEAL